MKNIKNVKFDNYSNDYNVYIGTIWDKFGNSYRDYNIFITNKKNSNDKHKYNEW